MEAAAKAVKNLFLRRSADILSAVREHLARPV